MAAELKPVLRMLVDEIQAVDVRIAELDRRMKDAARANEACRRLVEVPGIGPLIATAVVAAVPDDRRFSSGRHFAAWFCYAEAAFQWRQGAPPGYRASAETLISAVNWSMAPAHWSNCLWPNRPPMGLDQLAHEPAGIQRRHRSGRQ